MFRVCVCDFGLVAASFWFHCRIVFGIVLASFWFRFDSVFDLFLNCVDMFFVSFWVCLFASFWSHVCVDLAWVLLLLGFVSALLWLHVGLLFGFGLVPFRLGLSFSLTRFTQRFLTQYLKDPVARAASPGSCPAVLSTAEPISPRI